MKFALGAPPPPLYERLAMHLQLGRARPLLWVPVLLALAACADPDRLIDLAQLSDPTSDTLSAIVSLGGCCADAPLQELGQTPSIP